MWPMSYGLAMPDIVSSTQEDLVPLKPNREVSFFMACNDLLKLQTNRVALYVIRLFLEPEVWTEAQSC